MQAVSGIILQDHWRIFVSTLSLKIADSEPLKMVTGRIFGITVGNNFIETSKKLTIKDHNSRLFKNLAAIAYTKSTCCILQSLKKNIPFQTYPDFYCILWEWLHDTVNTLFQRLFIAFLFLFLDLKDCCHICGVWNSRCIAICNCVA